MTNWKKYTKSGVGVVRFASLLLTNSYPTPWGGITKCDISRNIYA